MRLLLSILAFLFALTPFCAADTDGWQEFVGPEMMGRLESVDALTTIPPSTTLLVTTKRRN